MRAHILHKDNHKIVNLNRRKAIRERCLNCSDWNDAEVKRCTIEKCALFSLRMGTGNQDAAARGKAIRKYCLQCMNNLKHEVVLCPSLDCPLFAFRLSTLDRTTEIKSESCRGHIEVVSEVVC